MTDTPRTLAAIKALLADNATQAISAQDLRDAIESIANPLPRGGFIESADRGQIFESSALTFSPNPILTVPSSNSGTRINLATGDGAALTDFYDPQGWIGVGSYVSASYSETLASGTYVRLPPGFYRINGHYAWEQHTDTGQRSMYADPFVDDRSTLTGGSNPDSVLLDPHYLMQNFADAMDSWAATAGFQNGTYQNYNHSWHMLVSEEMVAADNGHGDAGEGWVLSPLIAQSSGVPLKLHAWFLSIIREGDLR